MAQFGDRLVQAVLRTNTRTLVGIDPRLANLPDPL
ncbi:MAG TPA: orotidine 5'-phosphate decarboxylase, partial [Planctomycetaceae bacterium]|nr:orotidine 5'-phosphate decarboxylase [Planctomycetaceae bacterium]